MSGTEIPSRAVEHGCTSFHECVDGSRWWCVSRVCKGREAGADASSSRNSDSVDAGLEDRGVKRCDASAVRSQTEHNVFAIDVSKGTPRFTR